jgi:hypothetical protein
MRLRPSRPAYTLLEVVLASAIGVLLMAGLYTALELTLRNAQAGRDKVEQATLARSLFTRISGDILDNLGAPKPAQSGSSSGQGGGAGGSTGAGNTAQSGSSTSGGSSGASGGSSGTSGGSVVSGLGGTITFNLGVQGDNGTLVLYVSRVPSEMDPSWQGADVPMVSDLRRITYWLSSTGLCRQEIKLATSDDAIGAASDLPDDPSLVIAEEVKSVTFQYFDGSNWQDSWDGTQTPTAGGNNPQGPPVLVAVTLGLVIPGSSTESGDPKVRTFRYVIPIPTANGAMNPNQTPSSGTTSP